MNSESDRKSKDGRKFPTRMNRNLGVPRKWICYHNGGIDNTLMELEEVAHYARMVDRRWDYGKVPTKTLERLINSLQWMAKHLSADLSKRTTLTEVEQRYCELEGIEPGEFLKMKAAKI